MSLLEPYFFDGSRKCKMDELPTNSKKDKVKKEEILEKFQKNLLLLDELQNTFYSYKKEGMILVLQAMDAGGKDSLIRHVASGMNPQGVHVSCLKKPSEEELSHDYLWRIHQNIPRRGEITIFNRSYYEDIVTAEVHHLMTTYPMADRVIGGKEASFIKKRTKQVKNYETYLYENSYRVVKVFLHVSKEKQKERLLERLDIPEKNWKFEAGDLEEREIFDLYMKKYEKTISETASKECPWYVLPADQKWYTRYLLTEILIDQFKKVDAKYPTLSKEEEGMLGVYRDRLMNEE